MVFTELAVLRWFATNILMYSGLLVIGLGLRCIMLEWTVLFRRLDQEGSTTAVENRLEKSIARGRRLAYV